MHNKISKKKQFLYVSYNGTTIVQYISIKSTIVIIIRIIDDIRYLLYSTKELTVLSSDHGIGGVIKE